MTARLASLVVNQAALARELDVAVSMVWQWVNGETLPSADSLSRLADHYAVSVDWLLCRTNVRFPLPIVEIPEGSLIVAAGHAHLWERRRGRWRPAPPGKIQTAAIEVGEDGIVVLPARHPTTRT